MYFHGPHQFENGVYAKGTVDSINLRESEVMLHVQEFRLDRPITTPRVSARVAKVVAPRYRQVFVWTDDSIAAHSCELATCKRKECADCATWANLPLIRVGESAVPGRLRRSSYQNVVAAHWIVPRRCYWKNISDEVRELTRRFMAFKFGEMAYAYPFALSMFEQLRKHKLLEFDYVVPIPLSPDKIQRREKHRTRELAKELSVMLSVRMREMLKLSDNVSKRRMQTAGSTPAQFESRYLESLVANVPTDADRILVVDDVMTRGSTAAQALRAIEVCRPGTEVVIVTAGQMIVKEAVRVTRGFISA